MSGEIHICDKNSDKELVIDAQDILDFVADYVKSERIGMLEQMSTESILHLKSKFQVEVYNMGEKYRLIKDLDNEETWEFDKGNTILKEGIICYVQNWDRVLTIMFDGKAICDLDSEMAKDYFEKVS